MRFTRIAEDLEKLPCELHDTVLKDLEFEQLLRLSQTAGPRLTWSLENSLSTWSVYLRQGNIPRLYSLLEITDLVRKYCFKPPKSKESVSSCLHIWPPRQLRFLLYRGSDWALHEDDNRYTMHFWYYKTLMTKADIVDGDSLCSNWLSSLNEMVISTSWDVFHTDYARLVEPWVPSLACAATVFRKIPLLGEDQNLTTLQVVQTALSIQELHEFISLYQETRQVRAEALAAELCRLADIYEAHSGFLKQTFAPQTRRLNKQHIPTVMRNEARKLTKRMAHTWWKEGERYRYHFAFPFPGLVPYDWTLRLFDEVLQKHAAPDLPHHKGIVENAKAVHDALPTWARSARSFKALNEEINRWAPQNKKYMQPSTTSTMWEKAYQTHTGEDIAWLQKFCEVVAQMEKVFLEVVEGVRGLGWVIGAPQ